MGRVLSAAIAMLVSTAGFPQSDDWGEQMAEGAAAEAAGDYPRAASLYRIATEIAERFELQDKRRALAWNATAMMYDTIGQYAEAGAAYRRALKEAAESTGKTGPEYALVLANMGAWYVETGQAAAGEELVRKSLKIYLALDPRDEFRIAATQNGLGEILCLMHKWTEAGQILSRSLAVLEKIPAAWGETALARNSLGVVRFMEGNHEEARRLIVQGLAMMEQHLVPDHPMLIRFLSNLASLENRTGHSEQANRFLIRAVDIAKARLGLEHPTYALLLTNYAAMLRQSGDKSGAKAIEAQSTQILTDLRRRNGLGSVVDVSSLRRQ